MKPKLTVYFVNGTTVEVIDPQLVRVDPQVRVMMVKGDTGDDFVFVLDSIRYWRLNNPMVKQ